MASKLKVIQGGKPGLAKTNATPPDEEWEEMSELSSVQFRGPIVALRGISGVGVGNRGTLLRPSEQRKCWIVWSGPDTYIMIEGSKVRIPWHMVESFCLAEGT
jgi:hypothetical protein